MIESELMQEENISNPQEIPGLYCVTGESKCKDFDSEQTCQCSGCYIWNEYQLGKREPREYFCINFEVL